MDRTVLLVDDDERMLAGLIRALRKQPFHIFTAHSGEEATWVLKTREIDVIVADQKMPGMSGVELLTWVAENCPEVMRIVLTGHAETDMTIRAINEAGVCHFFTKPCNEASLAVAIHKAIEQKDAAATNRMLLDASRQELHDLGRLSQDFQFQARIISQDLHRPLARMEECCRRLEGQCLDPELHNVVADVQRAIVDAHQLVAQLVEAAAPNSP